jgi:hypothetical protein
MKHIIFTDKNKSVSIPSNLCHQCAKKIKSHQHTDNADETDNQGVA